ncbi:MAG: hypothetical protein ACHBN1_32300 [Heteroscytonema crispum UTEX LB 1556]
MKCVIVASRILVAQSPKVTAKCLRAGAVEPSSPRLVATWCGLDTKEPH